MLSDKAARKSDSYPIFEVTRPFCTCGRELSRDFYELTARDSFDDTMRDICGDKFDIIKDMVFNQTPSDLKSTRYKFCCRLSLSYGRTLPLSLEDLRPSVRRDQPPVTLPGALSKRKTIYWAC